MLPLRGLGTQLRGLTAALDGDVQSLYDEIGVDFRPRFYPIVQHLLFHGPSRVNVLAREIGVSQPAMTQTIGEMAKLGLVAASPGPDGRERLISLAPHGASVAESLAPVWRATERAARELNSELPIPLPEVIAATLLALHRERFRDRIQRMLDDG